jgi:hypothetical protein
MPDSGFLYVFLFCLYDSNILTLSLWCRDELLITSFEFRPKLKQNDEFQPEIMTNFGQELTNDEFRDNDGNCDATI